MNQSANNLSQSYVCEGKQLSSLRKRAGLTQKELGELAGYSERLVRKAEASGTLSAYAIRDLAKALCQSGAQVDIADLTSSPEKLALTILEAFSEHESEMAIHIESILDPQAVLLCAGTPNKIPFAGKWHRAEGFDRWARTFFTTLAGTKKVEFQPNVLTQGNTVVAWGEVETSVASMPPESIWVVKRLEFLQGKLQRMEILFDTEKVGEQISQAKALS